MIVKGMVMVMVMVMVLVLVLSLSLLLSLVLVLVLLVLGKVVGPNAKVLKADGASGVLKGSGRGVQSVRYDRRTDAAEL